MSKKIIKEGYDISQLPRIPKSSKWILSLNLAQYSKMM